ncbi:hypothetical protein HCN51_27490 [Nonomuraea sp. FMUSA5-5]|uniref:Uncharacterized protein n=1 Tax=Nonomuraea composti TaxID=2720023 RepID=A0ABX1B5N7_9ACTN|nr:hypothetical protein [Nonomuraea sp. FMUSA5-5]NJP93145.1 hypothetical protein [Nonomuraea sp. FMUSA5-5]
MERNIMSPSLRTSSIALATVVTSIVASAVLAAGSAHADVWGDCRPTKSGYTCHKLLEASILTCMDGGGDVPADFVADPTQLATCAGGRWDGVKLDPNEARRFAENAKSLRQLLGNLDVDV